MSQLKKATMLATLALGGAMLASSAAAQSTITVYTGRGKNFTDPIVKKFEADTGIKVVVKSGRDAEMVALLKQEGKNSPADVFWGNSMGAMGELDKAGMFSKLGANITRNAAPEYMPESSNWVPNTVRFRVLAYSTERIKPEQLPASVFDLPKMTSLKGRIGWTPQYPSFQDFLAAMISVHGEAKTKQWLIDMKALDPVDFKTSNMNALNAIDNKQIDVALTNHYYVQRMNVARRPVDTYFFAPGDVGNLGNSTGLALLKTSKNPGPAAIFIRRLQSAETQNFLMGVNFEYPAVKGTYIKDTLRPYDDVVKRSPRVDPATISGNLPAVQRILREVGLI